MIRTQQQQLHQLQTARGEQASTNVIDDSTPTSERSFSFPNVPHPSQGSSVTPRSPNIYPAHPPTRSSFDHARAELHGRSRTPSRTASPRVRATSISMSGEGEQWTLPPRDESAFYQAETQMLTRENQMLRMRIRELGKSQTFFYPLSICSFIFPSFPSSFPQKAVE
jgi:hypothetical protein